MFIDDVKKVYDDVTCTNIINIQNVADYEFNSVVASKFSFSDIFSFKFPFNQTWMEFKMPNVLFPNTTFEAIVPVSLAKRHYGILASESINIENNRAFVELQIFVYSDHGPYRDLTAVLEIDPKTGKHSGEDRDIHVITNFESKLRMKKFGFQENVTDEMSLILFKLITVPICSFLNFYHCKNVTLVKHYIDEKLIKSREKSKNKKGYIQKYYTLSIEPMKKVLLQHGSKSSGSKKAFHIVPGHFKEYKIGEDGTGGLFGKLEGVWFWNNHVRGNKKIGEIKKTYDINLKNITKNTKLVSRI